MILPEQELPIQIANVDRIHINDMNIFKSRESQIGKNLASQTTSPDAQNLALASQKTFDLMVSISVVRSQGTPREPNCVSCHELRIRPWTWTI